MYVNVLKEIIDAALSDPAPKPDPAAHLRALQPNWDSYSGKPITEAAINAALAVWNSRGKLTPCSNGGVQIDWANAEITFGPDGSQEFDAPETGAPEARPAGG